MMEYDHNSAAARWRCERNEPAFSLIELLVVIGIIAMLAALTAGVTGYSRQRALKARCLAQLHQMATALELYHNEYATYPITLADAPRAAGISHSLNGATSNNNLILYTTLTSYAPTAGPPQKPQSKSYLPDLTPGQLLANAGTNFLGDPYGNVWGYFCTTNGAWKANQYNRHGYDLWSFGPKLQDPTNSLICNWREP